MFWVKFIYYAHWALDYAFVAACLSVAFKPILIARVYVAAFLGQQLLLNGCIMTWLENVAEQAAGLPTSENKFIMSEILSGPLVTVYKAAFLIVAAIQIYYIYKEIQLWSKKKKATLH